MRKNNKSLYALAIICVLASLTAEVSDSAEGRFQAISNRNVFDLKAPTAPVELPPPPRLLPKLVLTGITTILGNKQALLKVQFAAEPGKTADPGKELSLILAEGQRDQNIEVLTIDEKAGAVKVSNSGTLMTLTFEKDGPGPPSAAAYREISLRPALDKVTLPRSAPAQSTDPVETQPIMPQ